MTEWMMVLAAALLLGWPLGVYLAAVMRGAPMRGDRVFGWIEKPIYALMGTHPAQGMGCKRYVGAFVLSNALLFVLTWGLLMTQAWLPLNPNGAPNMSWDLALHTAVSFLTNTNQQHYAGQAQVSFLLHMLAIISLQIITPMMGLALCVATLRALFGGRNAAERQVPGQEDVPVDVGNYWVDVVRALLRFMLPLCLVWSLALTSQGVPATFAGGPVATPVDTAAGMAEQKIPLGPVAPMVAIKQLGTNGGGWYGPNSAMPLENPTPLSNLLQTLALILVPVAVIFMLGAFTGRRKFAALVLGTMLTMSVVSTGAAIWSEAYSQTAEDAALMEGKEVRVGAAPSALWAALTTQTSNGSVNAMLDSAAPLTGLVAISDMLVNAIWGGIGCGLQQFLTYLLLGVFLAGLMTGRTPELFGRKIEAPEIKLLAVLVVLPPLLILGFSAVALAIPALTGSSNPGFHAVSQVLYEYSSAYANNGSGMEGLGDNTLWWNLSTAVLLLAGRYPVLIVPLVIASMLARKRQAPESQGSLQIETPVFALTLIAVIAVLTLLQFMPVLVLGPVADHLSLVGMASQS